MAIAESRQASLRDAFRIQCRVIGAVMMRELHGRYGRDNIGYIWLFLEPMMLATMIGLLHSRAGHGAIGDIHPVPMALVGYCNFMAFRSIISRSEGSIESMVTMLYHRTITIFDVLMARALLDTAATVVAFFILMALAVAFGITHPPSRPLYLLLGIVLMLLLTAGLSMIIAGITHERHAVGRLIHPLTYIMMPLSGAFFPMFSIPENGRDVLLYIPLAHIFEILRYGWFDAATLKYVDGMYLAGWVLGVWLIGLVQIATVRNRIHMP